MKHTVWTTTVDDSNDVITLVHSNEQAAFESLKINYSCPDAGDPDFDVTTLEGRAAMITWFTETGLLVYVDRHEVEL